MQKTSIVTAVKNSSIFLKIPELSGAQVVLNSKNNSPLVYTGGFNMVFQLNKGDEKWALRVWHVPAKDLQERFLKISAYLETHQLPYFVDFIYDKGGLIVDGIPIDTVRMKWIDGDVLKEYLNKNLYQSDKLEALGANFLQMCEDLRINQISHGDLQHGNIIIDKQENIRLIDYDSVCIPELEGMSEIVNGLQGYQHPSRASMSRMSLKADCFSELVIYLSIRALAEEPELWNKYDVENTEHLLFSLNDFTSFDKSNIKQDLQLLSTTIKNLVVVLEKYLAQNDFNQLTPFNQYLEPPQVLSFTSSALEILEGDEVTLSWHVGNADGIMIGNFKSSDSVGKLTVNSRLGTDFVLIAKNTFQAISEKLHINIYPIPIVKHFRIEGRDKIKYGKSLMLSWNIEHSSSVKLLIDGNKEEVSPIGQKQVSPLINSKYQLEVLALDKCTKITLPLEITVYKDIDINYFEVSQQYIIESQSTIVKWRVENYESLTLYSSNHEEFDITGETQIEVFPRKDTVYSLKGKNALFEMTSKKIQVSVQQLPIMPSLDVIAFDKQELLPKLDINLGRDVVDMLDKSELQLEQMMKKQEGTSLSTQLNKIYDILDDIKWF